MDSLYILQNYVVRKEYNRSFLRTIYDVCFIATLQKHVFTKKNVFKKVLQPPKIFTQID